MFWRRSANNRFTSHCRLSELHKRCAVLLQKRQEVVANTLGAIGVDVQRIRHGVPKAHASVVHDAVQGGGSELLTDLLRCSLHWGIAGHVQGQVVHTILTLDDKGFRRRMKPRGGYLEEAHEAQNHKVSTPGSQVLHGLPENYIPHNMKVIRLNCCSMTFLPSATLVSAGRIKPLKIKSILTN